MQAITPITRKKLVDWAGEQVVKDAERMLDKGLVVKAEYEPPYIRGAFLRNNAPVNASLRILPDGNAENECPCYENKERGIICPHVIAMGLMLVRRATDPLREARYQEELRRAVRLAQVDESEYVLRAAPDTPGAMPAALKITLAADWTEGARSGRIPITCELVFRGESRPVDKTPRHLLFALSKEDEALLYVLEDISEGPARGELLLNGFDFTNIIRLHDNRTLPCANGRDITINKAKIPTILKLDLDRENGELILFAHTELPFVNPREFPVYIIAGNAGWVYGADNIWPLEDVLPAPYRAIYSEPVIIKRPDVFRFMKQELPCLSKHAKVDTDLSLDLFTIDPGTPKFRLDVKGSPGSLAATLHAQYGDIELVACKPDAGEHFGIPDSNDLMRYTTRNDEAELAALIRLAPSGFRGEHGDDLSSIVGTRLVLNFLGAHLPALRRKGWQIELEGRVEPYMNSLDFAAPVVRINDVEGGNWFDVGFDFEDGKGESLSHAEIHQAIQRGEAFIKKGDRTILIDSDAIQAMQNVFTDCASSESDRAGHFRTASIFSAFVKSSLDALDGIDVEDTPAWRSRAEQCNRTISIEPVMLGEPLDSALRPYQKDGVNWLAFLEKQGFCGLLADEMGLGKTIQTLAWLDMERSDRGSSGLPALIVCPTSLVDNWIEEAARFVPDIKTLALSGADRRKRWGQIEQSDIVVTSYALLRRDLEEYLKHEFSAAVLDEAQHIKNRSSQNAVAAKSIRCRHKLVLTGTPLENSVADLWSIMDFLMPGYLGSHEVFRRNYEAPISHGKHEGEIAQMKLRRKMRPFLLRRLKTDVAKDLPAKIEKVSSCPLTKDQQMVYNEILRASQQKISGMVSKRGFNECRMEILTALLRLRQACCHLNLLNLPELESKYPSAKLELFMELLNEAVDSGHRMLVFSQFVSMLTILRKELEKNGVPYCYLDGATKERQSVVRKFNMGRDIPVFLISLKAGGTGLNLTGADMVVHFDPWWNPAVEDQATDRAHRIGQKRTVYSIKLITKNTVEEKVLAMQRKKKAVISATIESDEKMIQTLGWEDVQELLSL